MQEKQIYILDASAGTGKTYALAKHYIKLLLTTNLDIKTLLAVTFTNKAAIEMKQRILELLKKIALDKLNDKEKEDFNNTVVKLTSDVVIKAEKIVIEILKNYHYFQVQTIDSFMNTIISVSAMQLGMSPLTKIEADYNKYLRYSLDLLINTSAEDKRVKETLKNFLNSYLLIENKKSWYPKEDIFEIISKLYFSTCSYGKEFRKTKGKTNQSDILNLSNKLYNLVKQIYQDLSEEYVDKRFLAAMEKFLTEYKYGNKIVNINRNLSNYFTYEEIPTTKKGGFSADINNKWRKVRKILTQLCQIQAFQIYNPYIEIFNYIEKIFDKVTKQEDVVFLSEINKKVKQVVSLKEKFVPQLYIRLATRIQQCLIDEFQDTSVIQWENILPIVEEVLASGGMLFYVGDKKQSIYRFRGSDHQLFDEVVIKYFPQYRYEKDTLKINRRSKKVIVDFNNKIFSDENLEKLLDYLEEETGFMLKDEVLKIYSNSQQQPQEENTGGYIYGELVDIKINDYEEYVKQKVVKILSMIKNAESILPEVAVLVRDNKEVMKVSNWLLENNFAVESEKTLNIQENEFVKEIISLLKFLSTPFDNLSFASFILGETFILSCGISYEEIQKLVFEWSKNKKVYLYQYFQEIYPQVWNKYFSPIFEQSKFLPVYDLLIKIYSVFNFNSNYHFHNNYSFFYHLLKLAKKFEEENSSLQFFIEKFDSLLEEEKYVVAKGENLIKVMTIHKAKGLEFDIVILPFVELIVDVGRQKDTTSRFVIDTFNDNLYLVKLNQTMLNYYEKIKQLYEREYRKILIDELNVLYVSFTRAKRQIYFFVPDEKKNIAKFLFPWNGNNIIEVGIFDKDLQDKKNTTDNLPKYLPPLNHKDCSDILVEQKVDINEIVNKNKIIEGEIIHKIFSYIANLEGKNVNLEIDIAIKKTKSLFYFVPEEKWNRYKYLVNKIVFNKNFRKLFFVKDGYVFCEYEIVSSSGETKRVDRVLFYNDKLTIVEYKLHIHDEIENYKNQTEEYKQILLEIFKKPIEGYILFIDKMKLVKV